jgi:hypothetical protein
MLGQMLRAVSGARVRALQALINSLFGAGEQGAIYIPMPIVLGAQALFQDAAGTVPVTADGDPIGKMMDQSGSGNHAIQSISGRRPVYRTDGVLHWFETNGTNSHFQFTFPEYRNFTEVDFFYGIETEAGTVADNTKDFVVGSAGYYFSGFTGLTSGETFMLISDNPQLRLGSSLYSRAANTAGIVSFSIPNAGVGTLRTDGSNVPMNLTIGSNFSPSASSSTSDIVEIGSIKNTSFSAIKIYALIIRNKNSSTSETQQTESYIAALSGVAL